MHCRIAMVRALYVRCLGRHLLSCEVMEILPIIWVKSGIMRSYWF